jgi:hypothetical protein
MLVTDILKSPNQIVHINPQEDVLIVDTYDCRVAIIDLKERSIIIGDDKYTIESGIDFKTLITNLLVIYLKKEPLKLLLELPEASEYDFKILPNDNISTSFKVYLGVLELDLEITKELSNDSTLVIIKFKGDIVRIYNQINKSEANMISLILRLSRL